MGFPSSRAIFVSDDDIGPQMGVYHGLRKTCPSNVEHRVQSGLVTAVGRLSPEHLQHRCEMMIKRKGKEKCLQNVSFNCFPCARLDGQFISTNMSPLGSSAKHTHIGELFHEMNCW